MNAPTEDSNPPNYSKMDYFPVYGHKNGKYQVNAVSFNYILRTGDIRVLEENPSELPNQSLYTLDYFAKQGEDLVKCALDNIKNRVIAKVNIDPYISQLLTKSVWTRYDREMWEERLCDIVSRVVNEEQGFGEYLNVETDGVSRLRNLNETAECTEKDCEVFSAVEGSVIQLVENQMLSKYLPQSEKSWKQPLSYFCLSGAYSYPGSLQKNGYGYGYHQYILSPTGNIIEATHDPDVDDDTPYCRTGFSLELLARGELAYYKEDDKIYGGPFIKPYGMSMHAVMRDKLPEYAVLPYIEPQHATYTKDGSFALERFPVENGYIYAPVRKMDAGTPNERYVPLDRERLGGSDNYNFEYKDDISGYTYKFTCKDGQSQIKRYSHKASVLSPDYLFWEDLTASVSNEASPSMGSVDEKCTRFRDNIQSPNTLSDALVTRNIPIIKTDNTI